MHTFRKYADTGTYEVGNIERGEFGDEFVSKFKNLRLLSAVRIVCILNGGDFDPESLDEDALKEAAV